MGEVVNVIVAFAVIVFIVRWATSGKESTNEQSPAAILGFRPKNVTSEMVETIHSMFPDIPEDNIRYDLLRTGSVELTSHKLLERGFLPAPPNAYFTLYPRTQGQNAPPLRGQQPPEHANSTGKKQENLITRYHLEDRIKETSGSSSALNLPEEAGGKSTWEDTAEKREASLRERKARMILAARERLLAQQKEAEPSNTS